MPSGKPDTLPCSNCLFDQPWWLDVVAPGRWSEAVIAKGGNLAARWPFVRRRRFGLTYLTSAPFTPILGPSILPSAGKYVTRLSRETQLLSQLVDALPGFSYMSQRMHYSMRNWLPLYWKGWSQTTRYTYVLDDLSDPEQLWADLRENIRREVRKASRRVQVRQGVAIEEVWRAQERTFQRQSRKPRSTPSILRRLAGACAERDAGRTFAAVDSNDRVHAAAYIVWDDRSAYYLLGGGDPELRNSGAHSLVLWEAIRFAATVTQRFDFEGSMLQPVERYFRAFGARQVPYSKISRSRSGIVRAAMALRGS